LADLEVTGDTVGGILILLVISAFYLIPSMVAMVRHHPQAGPSDHGHPGDEGQAAKYRHGDLLNYGMPPFYC
jgi:hypothetical protein